MIEVQSGYADVNGARIYFEFSGSGELAVTLVHAGVADRRLWDGQFALLSQRYRVLRYDLRGFGQSSAPLAPYSHVEDLRDLLNVVGIKRTALIGCSMGGTTALDFLLAYPGTAWALVMVCGDPSGFEMQGAPPPLIQELIAAQQAGDAEKMAQVAVQIWGVGMNRAPEQVDQRVRDLVYEMSLIGFRNQLTGLGEPQNIVPPAVERLGDVRVPTLIIDGAEDNENVHRAGELMAQGIAGARRVVMPDTAHLPSLEHPDEFNAIVFPFLTEVLKQ
jgi:pimeloyl-ACP methyl ester carboxylesterase